MGSYRSQLTRRQMWTLGFCWRHRSVVSSPHLSAGAPAAVVTARQLCGRRWLGTDSWSGSEAIAARSRMRSAGSPRAACCRVKRWETRDAQRQPKCCWCRRDDCRETARFELYTKNVQYSNIWCKICTDMNVLKTWQAPNDEVPCSLLYKCY